MRTSSYRVFRLLGQPSGGLSRDASGGRSIPIDATSTVLIPSSRWCGFASSAAMEPGPRPQGFGRETDGFRLGLGAVF